MTRTGSRFSRVEPRRLPRAFVLGLLAGLPRKNCRTIAGIPATVTSATKPQLAKRMIERAAGAAVPFAWVAGGEVYGNSGPLRTWLETRRSAYVLAVASDHRVPAGAGRTLRADDLAAHLLSSLTIRPAHDTSHQMRWSRSRRRHQHRARTCHYQRQQPKTRGRNDLRLEY
jgi:SRSO17 transposase